MFFSSKNNQNHHNRNQDQNHQQFNSTTLKPKKNTSHQKNLNFYNLNPTVTITSQKQAKAFSEYFLTNDNFIPAIKPLTAPSILSLSNLRSACSSTTDTDCAATGRESEKLKVELDLEGLDLSFLNSSNYSTGKENHKNNNNPINIVPFSMTTNLSAMSLQEISGRNQKSVGEKLATHLSESSDRIDTIQTVSETENCQSSSSLPVASSHKTSSDTPSSDQRSEYTTIGDTSTISNLSCKKHFLKLQKYDAEIRFLSKTNKIISGYIPVLFVLTSVLILIWFGISHNLRSLAEPTKNENDSHGSAENKEEEQRKNAKTVTLILVSVFFGFMAVLLMITKVVNKRRQVLVDYFSK